MQPVTIYTTPYCPYCIRAKMLLDERGVTELNEIRIDQDRELRKQMIERTGRRTVPQIYIGDHHVGGCDDLVALDREGKLEALLQG
ncbi:glutaredoxin 3 [Brachymonas chironomi]|uniref:glutaredoxin 3 n=1 Tax=Brachymonas chironomi TaxID=491919 RepID=UPI00037C6647|nr:glutaredoxin 3 [Brachymonas chironomi]